MSGVGSTPPVPPPPTGGQATPAPASTPATSTPPASPQASVPPVSAPPAQTPPAQTPPVQSPPAQTPSGGGQSGAAPQPSPPPPSSGAAAQISASLSELAKGGQFSAQVVARDGQALLVRTAAGTTLALNNLATLLAQANTAVLAAALKLQLNPANPQQATVVSANGVTLQPPLTVQAQPPTTAQMQLAISPPQPNAGAAVLPTAGQSLGAVVVPQPLLSGGGTAAPAQSAAAVLPPGSQLQLVVQGVTPPGSGPGPAVATAALPGSVAASGAPPVITPQATAAAPAPQIPAQPGAQPVVQAGTQASVQAGVQVTPATVPTPGAALPGAAPAAAVPLPGAPPAAPLPGSPPLPPAPAAPPVAPSVTAAQPAVQPLPPAAALTASSLPQTIAGVVTGQNQAGQVLLNTPQGLLALNLTQPLPPGTQLALELTALVRPSSPAATTIGPQPLAGVLARLQGQWPALQQTLDALRAADPALAQRVQNDLLPQPNGRLASTSVQFMAAAAVGSAQAWLGSEAVRRLEQQGRSDLLRALDDDFRDIGRLNQRQGDTNWQALVMPMLIGGRVEPIHIFMRRRRDPKRKQDQTRFIIDFNLESTGPIQFDGLVSVKHLDLILRSESTFGPAFRMDVIAIFEEAQAVTGMTGSIRFLDHEPPLPWPSPELELRGSTTELKV